MANMIKEIGEIFKMWKDYGLTCNISSHENVVFMTFDKEQKNNGQDHLMWMVRENNEENQTTGWLGMWKEENTKWNMDVGLYIPRLRYNFESRHVW